MSIRKTDAQLGCNTIEPRTAWDLQILASDVEFKRIDVATFRQRLVFFCLNAKETELLSIVQRFL